jgi:Ca2+:H+ antiporter
MNMRALLKPSLNWLLVCVPAAVWMEHFRADSHLTIFALACLAVLPLAGWLGTATEHLAARTGEGIGGLLNATFGNAAEMIIALMALQKGLYDVVKASLTGSIIGNILLVMGLSFLAGGYKHSRQQFNTQGARTQASMLTLAAIALVVPAAFHYLSAPAGRITLTAAEGDLSLEIAIVLLTTYVLSLLFSLHTHKQLFSGGAHGEHADGEVWSAGRAMGILLAATVFIAWMSEILVGSVEQAAHQLGMSSIFVGVIVVAIIGNAAEHSTAILMAMKNRMDLSIGIAIGSSIQIALFVAPVLVLASYWMGPGPMNLVFTPAEVMATGLAVAITGQVARDGESNWFEGVQLLAVYVILGILFYFLPVSSHN